MHKMATPICMMLMLASCTPPKEERNIPRAAEGPLKAREQALSVEQMLNEAAARKQQEIDEQASE